MRLYDRRKPTKPPPRKEEPSYLLIVKDKEDIPIEQVLELLRVLQTTPIHTPA